MSAFKIPAKSSLLALSSKGAKSKYDLKPDIDAALDDETIAAMNDHLTNGGTEGHKLLDQAECWKIVETSDMKRGGRLAKADMPKKQKIDQMMIVLRRYYTFDKHGKVIGVNPKRYTLIGNAG